MKRELIKIFLLACGLNCVWNGVTIAQTPEVDSMKALLKTPLKDTTRLFVLDDLSWTYLEVVNDYDKAIETAQQLLMFARKKGIADYYPVAYSTIGLSYSHKGNHPLALKNLFLSLRESEKLKDEPGEAAAYSNIGAVYDVQENFDQALKYYYKALHIYENAGDEFKIGIMHNNIGVSLLNKGNLHEALQHQKISKRIMTQNNDKIGMADAYHNIADIYSRMKKYDSSLYNYKITLKLEAEVNRKNGMAGALINMGGLYLQTRKFPEARDFLKKGNVIALSIGHKEWIKKSYQYLTALDSATGNWEKAFKYKQLYVLYRDSLLNEENTRKIVQQQMHYDFTKKRVQDSIVNAAREKIEVARHNKVIREQRLYTYIGIAGFLLMLMITVISFRAYRQKRATNAAILLQKSLVEQKQNEMLDSIRYAKRIQQAQLPSEKTVAKSLSRLMEK